MAEMKFPVLIKGNMLSRGCWNGDRATRIVLCPQDSGNKSDGIIQKGSVRNSLLIYFNIIRF